MDQEFIKLMQILLGNPNPFMPSSSHKLNPDYAAAIIKHVGDLNNTFGIKSCENEAFIGESPCFGKSACTTLSCGFIGRSSYPVIGPVPFASSGEKPAFAVFGLNPLFDKKDNSGCREKDLARNTLSDYAAFYNSSSFALTGVFPFVFNPLGKYYRNIFILIYSLCKGEFKDWDSIFPYRKTKEDKIAIANTYLELIKHCPIIVPELIPFHSASSKVDIKKLYNTMPIYIDYHEKLLKVIDKKMHPNGIIFVHGDASCKAIKGQVFDSLQDMEEFPKGKKKTHLIGTWKGRVVAILSSFVGARNGAFQSNENIENLIVDILDYMKKYKKSLPCSYIKLPNEEITKEEIYPKNSSDLYVGIGAKIPQEEPNETTTTIHIFTDDTKGLREEDEVKFPESRKKGAPLITGIIKRIFKNNKTGKEEATIKSDRPKPYFRYEHEITKIPN